ncbi:MAG: hypothetical protein A2V70_15565, partial [Planctomycetes bacterium RBG_13_63_9]
MHYVPASGPIPRRAHGRGAFSLVGLLIAVGLVGGLLIGAWFVLPSFSFSAQDGSGPMMVAAERKEFIHDVTERGSLESASNVEIRCEVESKGGAGTTILEIVPEGTYIGPEDVGKKVLVKLDSSALEDNETQQKIVYANSEAMVTQAQNVFDTAKISKQEYLEGTCEETLLDFEIKISEAEVTRDQMKEYLEFSQRLERKGYITKQQLQNDERNLEKAENQLRLLEKQIKVFEEFTKPKMVGQLEADIKTARARLLAEEASHKLDVEKLTLMQEQIKKCTIVAPDPGQVVYANREGHRGDREVVIEEGTVVRENQTIIRLPDPKRMQVKAKINEARIGLVEEGMSVFIQLDAFPELELTGILEDVSDYPASTSWFRSDVKEYETTVKILDSGGALPEGQNLRPGLTAQVKIRVEHLDKVLQVPVQAIIEHRGKHYCVLYDTEGFRAQQVTIGPTNDKVVVIEGGLEAGQQVVLGAGKYRDEVGLAKLPQRSRRTQ